MALLFENDINPAMRFEGLARFAFGSCLKGKDPWSYSKQERYINFYPKPTEKGKRILSTIFIKLVIDNLGNSDFVKELIFLENKIWVAEEQIEIVRIIDKCILLIKDYHNDI